MTIISLRFATRIVPPLISSSAAQERKRLEKALQGLDEAELFFARQYQAQRFSEENWERMSREWRDQRIAIQNALQVITCDQQAQVASLDDALKLIAKAGILFKGLSPQGQRELLCLMVEKVVIGMEGQLTRVELRPPFGYLTRLITSDTDMTDSFGNAATSRNGKNGRRKPFSAGSIFIQFGALGRNRTFDPPLQICAGLPALWTFPLPCDRSFR
jgi:hypothetical protein